MRDCSGKGPEGTRPTMLEGHESPVRCLAYQHKGPLLASAARDGRLMTWRPNKQRQPLHVLELDTAVSQVAWSPDDQTIAVGTESGMVALYRQPQG
ncbi:WD domain, G-beta repeat [compost metagenome]